MASSLEQFLSVKEVGFERKTVPVTTKDGQQLEVDVRQLPLDQFKRIRARSTFTYPTPTGGVGASQLDEMAFALSLSAAGMIAPNLNDKKLRKHCHAFSSEEVLTYLFPFEEIGKIAVEITQLTLGTEEEIVVDNGVSEEKLQEAKN